MIKTVLMDYDSTIHDMDGVMERSLDGVLGYSGADLYRIWVFDVHRALIHAKHLDRHDDMMFHCKLLFDELGLPFDEAAAEAICEKFAEAHRKAETLKRTTGKRYFDHTFSETSLGLLKTEPGYYVKALGLIGAEASETVSVGDTPLSDIRPAKLAGTREVWVNRNMEAGPGD